MAAINPNGSGFTFPPGFFDEIDDDIDSDSDDKIDSDSDSDNKDQVERKETITIEELSSTILNKPDDLSARRERAQKYYSLTLSRSSPEKRREYLDRALEDACFVLSQDPNDLAMRTLRIKLYGDQDCYERSIEDYTFILDQNRGNHEDRDNLYFLKARSDAYFRLQRYKEAIADLSSVLDASPTHSSARIDRGKAYCKLGQHKEAMEDFDFILDASLAHDPFSCFTRYPALIERGNAYFEMKQYKEAIADLSIVLNAHTTSSAARTTRGRAYFEMGQYKEAMEDFSIVLHSQWPDFTIDQYKNVIADLSRILEANPTHVDARTARAMAYLELEQYEESIADFSHILDKEPNHITILSKRGKIYLHLKEYSKALSDLNRALELLPEGDFEIQKLRALAYLYLGEHTLALVNLEALLHHPLSQKELPAILSTINQALQIIQQKTSSPLASSSLNPVLNDLKALHKELDSADSEDPRDFQLTPGFKGSFTPDLHQKREEDLEIQSRYEFLYKLLIALQELEQNRETILQLNNNQPHWRNRGEMLACALSGIQIHFESNPDVKDPIGQFLDTLLQAYHRSKEKGQLLEFFKMAFNRNNLCLGAKFETLKNYAARFEMSLETTPDINASFTDNRNAGEFFRAFRVQKIQAMAEEKQLDPVMLKAEIESGDGQYDKEFYSTYCSRKAFEQYLKDYPASPAVIAIALEYWDAAAAE